ncbi:hypothetical protein D3C71_1723840 [compost metagenome]
MLSVSKAKTFGSSFFKSSTAAVTSASLVEELERPAFLRAMPIISRLSSRSSTLPLYSGFHKSSQLSISSFTYFVLYAIPVTPDVYTTEYLLSGSKEGFLYVSAIFSKFGIFALFSGASRSCLIIVATM